MARASGDCRCKQTHPCGALQPISPHPRVRSQEGPHVIRLPSSAASLTRQPPTPPCPLTLSLLQRCRLDRSWGPRPTHTPPHPRPAVPSALRVPCFRGGVGTPLCPPRPPLCSLPLELPPAQPTRPSASMAAPPTSHLLPKPRTAATLGSFLPHKASQLGLEGRKGTKGCTSLRPVSLVCALVLGSGATATWQDLLRPRGRWADRRTGA